MISTKVLDDVTVLAMEAGENRINSELVTALASAVETAAERAKPLVLTGEGKFFSNGLDVDWIRSAGRERTEAMFGTLHRTLARLLTFPGATATAINGHVFGAGVTLPLVTDHRAMRLERGYFCFPEVDLGIPISDEVDAVFQAKLATETILPALLSGRRYSGEEAKAAGLVHAAVPGDQLLETALDLVRPMAAKDGENIARIKAKMFEPVVATLCPDGF